MGCSSSSQVAPAKKISTKAPPLFSKSISDEQRQRINAIIDYWFREGWDRESYPGQDSITKKWFSFSLDVDRDVREKFLADYESYMKNEFADWLTDRDGKLAAIILLDQYSRQLFRRTPRAFEADEKA